MNNLFNFVNAALNTVGVVLILAGAYLIQSSQRVDGLILIVAGFLAYLVYEYTPTKPTT